MTVKKPGDDSAKTRASKAKPLGDGGATSPFAAMQQYSQENVEKEAAGSQYPPMYEPPGELQFDPKRVYDAFIAALERRPRTLVDEPKNLKGQKYTLQEIVDTQVEIDPARSLAVFENTLANSLRQAAAKQQKPKIT